MSSSNIPRGLFADRGAFDQSVLLSWLASQQFQPLSASPNSRGVLHYGEAGYNYGAELNKITVEPIPPILTNFINDFLKARGLAIPYNSIIVNRYIGDQGITQHIDKDIFGDHVLCFILGDGATIEFQRDKELFQIYLKGGDVYLMTDESRWEWSHGIKKRKNDVVDGIKVPRGTRYSITCRQKN